MNHWIVCSMLALLPVAVALAADAPAAPPAASFPLDAYAALGTKITSDNRLHQLGWTEEQIEAFIAGVRGAFKGEPRPMIAASESLAAEVGRRVQELDKEESRRQFGREAFAQPGYMQKYLRDMRARLQLQASDSGLVFGIKVSGGGPRPEPEDTVVISYKVHAADGKTEIPGLARERTRVKVQDLVPGLVEALQLMSVGSGAVLILPPELSFGSGEWPEGAERDTPLIFSLVLHEIVEQP